MSEHFSRTEHVPVRLVHVTSIEALESILRSGVFRACAEHPLNGDAGLNCFISDRKCMLNQHFEGQGVALFLSWEGPIRKLNQGEWPPAQNVLYDMLPWRCFIPVNSELWRPRVLGFKVTQWALDDFCGQRSPTWYPQWLKTKLKRAAKLAVLLKLRGLLEKRRGSHLSIRGPCS
jgi:hypothetical protein